MQEAIDASQCRQFMAKFKLKFIVIYEDEEGSDAGGVRWEVGLFLEFIPLSRNRYD